MTAGRKPMPPALRLMTGRTAGTDSGGRKVVQLPFRRMAPKRPEWLSALAAEHWDHLIPELSRMDILKQIDMGALAMCCESFARWRGATEALNALGSLTGENSQGLVRHPLVGVAKDAAAEYGRWCSVFGLTPGDEGRLRPKEGDGGSEETNPF